MNQKQFEEVFNARINLCRFILLEKNTEYARDGDKLSNFKKAAGMLSIPPEYALLGMMVKHQVSIADLIQDLNSGIHHPLALWEEKIGDEMNYLLLLRALLAERYEYGKEVNPFPGVREYDNLL